MKKESRFVSSHRPGRALCLPFTLPASHSGLCKGKNTLAKTLRGSHEECENFTRNGRKKGKENERMEENTKYEGDKKKSINRAAWEVSGSKLAGYFIFPFLK